ncbi:unnamed protein product [Musa hybrid cultivar]
MDGEDTPNRSFSSSAQSQSCELGGCRENGSELMISASHKAKPDNTATAEHHGMSSTISVRSNDCAQIWFCNQQPLDSHSYALG